MAGDGDNVENAAAEVKFADAFGPLGEAKGLLDHGEIEGDEFVVGIFIKLRVAGDVIAMAVGVDDHSLDGLAAFAKEPAIDHLIIDSFHIDLASAGVNEGYFVVAEDDVEEGLFVVGAAGFAEDVEVWIVFVDLPVGDLHAFGAAGDPMGREDAGFDVRAIGLGNLRVKAKEAGNDDEGESA